MLRIISVVLVTASLVSACADLSQEDQQTLLLLSTAAVSGAAQGYNANRSNLYDTSCTQSRAGVNCITTGP